MSEHTPGPWMVEGITLVVARGGDRVIAETAVDHYVPEDEANAQFIAAAPKTKAQRDALLVACKAMVAAFDEALGGLHVDASTFNRRADASAQAHAAIAAADGFCAHSVPLTEPCDAC